MLSIECPHCAAKYNVKIDAVGKRARCKKCQNNFLISLTDKKMVALSEIASVNATVTAAASWYQNHARSVLEKVAPNTVSGYDAELKKINDLINELPNEKYPVCVIGEARVGKSTLINTLVGGTDIVVPSGGGSGPLTASALSITYGDKKRFTVFYQDKRTLNSLRLSLEMSYKKNDHSPTASAESETEVQITTVPADAESDIPEAPNEADNESLEIKRKRACLLVKGNQDTPCDHEYLIDALRFAQGLTSRFQRELAPEDLERLNTLKDAYNLGSQKKARTFIDDNHSEFEKQLRLHACGILAPLIDKLQIEWDTDILKNGVEIIDLPGLGIYQDQHQEITKHFLKTAKSVMLVVGSGGLTEAVANSLVASNFLTDLLHDNSAPFLVAAVKIDDVANENWRNDRDQNRGKALKNRDAHFAEVVDSMRETVKNQITDFLPTVWRSETDQMLNDAKVKVLEQLAERVRVFPVSAPQYRLFLDQEQNPDDNDKPFISDKEATQIPALAKAMEQAARNYIQQKETRLREYSLNFFGGSRAILQREQARLDPEIISAANEQERRELTERLDIYLRPKQTEYANRQGAFRNFLRETMPEKITAGIESAAARAKKEIDAYLGVLSDYHWATLKAAVVRGGTFAGSRHIDLPNDISRRFEEPVADTWSQTILRSLRAETKKFADYQNAVMQEISAQAKKNFAVKLSLKVLDGFIEEIKRQATALNTAGKEAVVELKEQVKSELYQRIERPITSRCRKFVGDGDACGPGVKARVLTLFGELATDAVEKAKEAAMTLLTARFIEVEREIAAAFEKIANPIDGARDALLQVFAREQDRDQKAEAVQLTAINAAWVAIPDELAAVYANWSHKRNGENAKLTSTKETG
ncbi:hypothetical protein AGMMS49959_18050 [Planctomycetales bacterium]|nr:hypothetical protein AGMMS49959_18050 [Planctomycetales bacterium]